MVVDERRWTSHYSALLVRFFAGLLSPGTFLSSASSGLLLPKTGPAGTLPKTTGLPARLAGLVKPAGRSELLLTDFEGALSLVWKSSLGAALLAGSPIGAAFFFGGDEMRPGVSLFRAGTDAGAGNLLVAFFRGTAFALVVDVTSLGADWTTSTGDRDGASCAFAGVANLDRFDCFCLRAGGADSTGSSERTDVGALPEVDADRGALSFLTFGLLGVSAAGTGKDSASSLSGSASAIEDVLCNFGAVLESPSSNSCTSGSGAAS